MLNNPKYWKDYYNRKNKNLYLTSKLDRMRYYLHTNSVIKSINLLKKNINKNKISISSPEEQGLNYNISSDIQFKPFYLTPKIQPSALMAASKLCGADHNSSSLDNNLKAAADTKASASSSLLISMWSLNFSDL